MPQRYYTKEEWDQSLRLVCAAPSFRRYLWRALGGDIAKGNNIPAALVARQCRLNRGERVDDGPISTPNITGDAYD